MYQHFFILITFASSPPIEELSSEASEIVFVRAFLFLIELFLILKAFHGSKGARNALNCFGIISPVGVAGNVGAIVYGTAWTPQAIAMIASWSLTGIGVLLLNTKDSKLYFNKNNACRVNAEQYFQCPSKKGMKNVFGTLAGIGYVAMLIAQFCAIWDGIGTWWGIRGIFRIIVVLFIDAIPILGQFTGVVSAHDCWGWSWAGAFLLFFWPVVLILVAVIFTKNEK